MKLDHWTDLIERHLMKGPDGRDVQSGVVDGLPSVTVKTYQGLVRTIGYVKYMSRANVLMRGQTSCSGSMKPQAYRGATPSAVDAGLDFFFARVRAHLNIDRAPAEQASTEPIFQHYGIRTRWLDLVDAIPHALFFALHEFKYLDEVASIATYGPTSGDVGYIYLIDCSADEDLHAVRVLDGVVVRAVRGVWESSDGFQLCDLRRAKPSKALRPHAQHGYLCRPPPRHDNLWERVLLRLIVPAQDARRWLGNGTAVSFGEMFPGPEADQYYKQLLFAQEMRGIVQATQDEYPPLRLGNIVQYRGA